MKDKIIVFTFIIYLLFFSIAYIVIKDDAISFSERRKLAQFPEFKFESDYINNVDKYLLDHYPFRDNFRSFKAKFNYSFLHKLDNNDIYLKDNFIFKSNYPTNNKSINNFQNHINKILENNKIKSAHLLVVPDKNYYIEDSLFLNIDYDYIYDELKKLDLELIDIRDIMELSDYYETDTHWKQENLLKVIKELSNHLNFKYEEYKYNINTFDNFYGVYYGESAINRKPERITYLSNEIINNANVKYLENDKLTTVYNEANLKTFDSYEIYLDGASSFIEIINKDIKNKKELVIFRDSFGSSITPLLIPYYSKITIIDNRYINSVYYNELIDLDNKDVLFIYSTLIINNSYSLKN